jgi:hypothetical protein
MQRRVKLFSPYIVLLGAMATGLPAWAQDQGATDADKRTPVVLRPNEKSALLTDMREYLKGLQVIFTALAKEDMDSVAAQAKALGTINVFNPGLNFPTVSGVKFRELASQVHEDFEDIAANAKARRNPKTTLEKLSVTMKRCVSCHEAFYLTDKF